LKDGKLPRVYKVAQEKNAAKRYVTMAQLANGQWISFLGKRWLVEGAVLVQRSQTDPRGCKCLLLAPLVSRMAKNNETLELLELENELKFAAKSARAVDGVTLIEFLSTSAGDKYSNSATVKTWLREQIRREAGLQDEKAINSNVTLRHISAISGSAPTESSNTLAVRDGMSSADHTVPDLPLRLSASEENDLES
jgi:hypothetical protein